MGSAGSNLRFEQPPVPPIDQTFDLDDPNFSFLNENRDPEGYKMCTDLALREGATSGFICLGILASASIFIRKRASMNSNFFSLI